MKGGANLSDDKNKVDIAKYNRVVWDINFRVDFYFDRVFLGAIYWNRELILQPQNINLPITQQEWKAYVNQ